MTASAIVGVLFIAGVVALVVAGVLFVRRRSKN